MKTGLESSTDANQLRALDILAEDPGQFPAHTWWNSTTPRLHFHGEQTPFMASLDTACTKHSNMRNNKILKRKKRTFINIL